MAASNLALRFATAAVGVPAILGLLYKAPHWAFYLLVFPAILIGAWELFSMTHSAHRLARLFGVGVTAAVSLVVFFWPNDARVLFTLILAVSVLGPIATLARPGDMQTAALRAATMSFGPVFIGIPLTLLGVLRHEHGDVGSGYVLYALGFAWFSDTGGYFAGRFLGKHKLYEAVSPKKTVEGAIGGLLVAIAWGALGHFTFLRTVPLSHGLALGFVASALGQVGDLAESLLKRSTGVKDSGNIVPGHGGILDRVDAVILTTATVYLYTLWLAPESG